MTVSPMFLQMAFGPGRVVYETTLDGHTSHQSLTAAGEPGMMIEARCADYERRVRVNGGTCRRVTREELKGV